MWVTGRPWRGGAPWGPVSARFRCICEERRAGAAGCRTAFPKLGVGGKRTGARAKDDGDPALQGWKARSCTASVTNGIVSVRNLTEASFLGFAAGKHSGASTVRLRIKAGGGASHFDWLPGGVQDQAHSVPFTLAGGDWQEVTIEVPATGPLGIVRIYLPKQDQPIEIDWIEITSNSGGKPTRTEF